MLDQKLVFTMMNILIFQTLLALSTGLTVTHQMIAIFITIGEHAQIVKKWFEFDDCDSLCSWDDFLHIGLAYLLLLSVGISKIK